MQYLFVRFKHFRFLMHQWTSLFCLYPDAFLSQIRKVANFLFLIRVHAILTVFLAFVDRFLFSDVSIHWLLLFPCLSLCPSLYVSLSLCLSPFLYLSFSLSISPSLCLSFSLSLYLSLFFLSLSLSFPFISISLCISLSLFLSVSLFFSLSLSLLFSRLV